MKDATPDVNQRIARRVAALRAEQGLSLDTLAAKSGVSRSMISLIERGETSPTASVLEKLAAGFGVVMASLFDAPATGESGTASPIARRTDQPEWRDPASGYVRRNVSPAGVPQPMRIVEVQFPPGGRVAFDADRHDSRIYQQIWVISGAMDITHGKELHRLREGDCLAVMLDRPKIFHNPTRKITRYVVVTVDETPARR